VGEQLARERDGLGPLQVRVPRQRDPFDASGTLAQRLAQVEDRADDLADAPPGVEPQRRCHLVVAAPRRVELGAGVAGELGDAAFDRRVDVLVAGDELEAIR